MNKTYTISLEGFSAQEGENVLDAVKRFVEILKTCDLEQMVYSVTDEETGEEFSVDLGEDDEEAVLPK